MSVFGTIGGAFLTFALSRWLYRRFWGPKHDENWVIKYLEKQDEQKRERQCHRSTKYRVERLGRDGEGIAPDYRYRVWRGSEPVADVLHDHRFDYHWFEINGVTHDYVAGKPFPIDWERNSPVYMTLDGEKRLDRILGSA